MDFNQLRYFQTVARCESMTKAAEELHITQSALSKVIARLESELGVQLFVREHKRLMLNENGVRLLQFTISSFDALDPQRDSKFVESFYVFDGPDSMITPGYCEPGGRIGSPESNGTGWYATQLMQKVILEKGGEIRTQH